MLVTLLVGCVLGCLYKYCKNEDRGADVIPGMPYYRRCWDFCFGTVGCLTVTRLMCIVTFGGVIIMSAATSAHSSQAFTV